MSVILCHMTICRDKDAAAVVISVSVLYSPLASPCIAQVEQEVSGVRGGASATWYVCIMLRMAVSSSSSACLDSSPLSSTLMTSSSIITTSGLVVCGTGCVVGGVLVGANCPVNAGTFGDWLIIMVAVSTTMSPPEFCWHGGHPGVVGRRSQYSHVPANTPGRSGRSWLCDNGNGPL